MTHRTGAQKQLDTDCLLQFASRLATLADEAGTALKNKNEYPTAITSALLETQAILCELAQRLVGVQRRLAK